VFSRARVLILKLALGLLRDSNRLPFALIARTFLARGPTLARTGREISIVIGQHRFCRPNSVSAGDLGPAGRIGGAGTCGPFFLLP
jgi:hypothetical protein